MKSLAALLSLLVFSAGAALAAPVSIRDDAGRTVTLPAPASRIIPLYGAFTEMLFAFGAGGAVIARTQADHDPKEIETLPPVGTHMHPNVEMIIGLKPDLVLVTASRWAASAELDRIEKAGVPVAVFEPKTFEGIFSVMERLGVLSGREAEAKAAVSTLRARLDAVKTQNAALPRRPRVFFEVRAEPLAAAGRGSIAGEIIAAAGAENAVASDQPIVQMNVEALLMEEPDLYVVQKGPMNPNPRAPKDRPHIEHLRAVREGRVLMVDEMVFSRPGPRAVEAVEILSKALREGGGAK